MKFVGKTEKIVEMCRGKNVLHLGCVGFADAAIEDRIRLAEESLHALLSKVASTIKRMPNKNHFLALAAKFSSGFQNLEERSSLSVA